MSMNLYQVINQEHNAQEMMARMMEEIIAKADADGFDVELHQDEIILIERTK